MQRGKKIFTSNQQKRKDLSRLNYPNVEVSRFYYIKENRGKDEQNGQKEYFKKAYAK